MGEVFLNACVDLSLHSRPCLTKICSLSFLHFLLFIGHTNQAPPSPLEVDFTALLTFSYLLATSSYLLWRWTSLLF
jgi:hypothetical protein